MQLVDQRPEKYSWSSDVIYRRSTNQGDFMPQENVLARSVCEFHSGFRTNPPPNTTTKSAQYHVGSTVVFEGDSYPLSASVGVIIAMYGIVAQAGNPNKGERKRVKIHRFVRFGMIDGVQVSRFFNFGCVLADIWSILKPHSRQLFYPCSGSVIVRPSDLLRHCKVLNDIPLDLSTDYFCRDYYDEHQDVVVGSFDWIAHRNTAKISRQWDIDLEKVSAREPVELDVSENEPAHKKFKGIGGQVEAVAAQQQRQSGPSGSSNAKPIERPSAGLPESKKRPLSELQGTSDPRARSAGQGAQAGILVPAAALPPQLHAACAQIPGSMIQTPSAAPVMRTMYDPFGLAVFS